jgi:hypothetical protein
MANTTFEEKQRKDKRHDMYFFPFFKRGLEIVSKQIHEDSLDDTEIVRCFDSLLIRNELKKSFRDKFFPLKICIFGIEFKGVEHIRKELFMIRSRSERNSFFYVLLINHVDGLKTIVVIPP